MAAATPAVSLDAVIETVIPDKLTRRPQPSRAAAIQPRTTITALSKEFD